MKTAKLSMLGLEVPVGYFQEFHDDGFVKSIEHHYTSLTQRYYGFPADSFPEEAEEVNPIGLCSTWRPKWTKYIHIYYLDRGSEMANVHVRAHEETHALCRLGKLSLLEEALEREQKVHLPLHKIGKKHGEQVVAELGALYARVEWGLWESVVGEETIDEEMVDRKVMIDGKSRGSGAPATKEKRAPSFTCKEYLQAIQLYNEASPIWKVELKYRPKERRA